MKRNKIIIFLIFSLILPVFSFAKIADSQIPEITGPPQTLEGVKEIGLKALKFFPETFKKNWQEIEVWLKKLWNSYIYPPLHKIWQKIENSLKKEIKERKPIIKEEFKKEKQEMKEEVPLFGKSLWEKFKELIK